MYYNSLTDYFLQNEVPSNIEGIIHWELLLLVESRLNSSEKASALNSIEAILDIADRIPEALISLARGPCNAYTSEAGVEFRIVRPEEEVEVPYDGIAFIVFADTHGNWISHNNYFTNTCVLYSILKGYTIQIDGEEPGPKPVPARVISMRNHRRLKI